MPAIAKHIRNIMVGIITIMLTFAVCSCHKHQGPALKDAQRSVYYWRTTFALNNSEKAFLTSHHITRMYLHLFDVVNKGGAPMPDATLLFSQQMPQDMDIVPIVYITNDVISSDSTNCPTLAQQIVNRVTQMMQAYNITWHELQIDFDWTKRTQASYFAMLRTMRKQLKGKGLSATIRLHQLSLTPPPVDYGALMVYNIGRYNDPDEPNSILSISNLKPYLPHLADYSLPLATALPLYSWDLAFEGDKFIGIARGLNLNDTATYYHIPDSHGKGDLYMVKRYHTLLNDNITLLQQGIKLYPRNIIRHEDTPAQLLLEVRDMLRHNRANALDEVILYHLDNNNLKKYSNEQIETLLGRH